MNHKFWETSQGKTANTTKWESSYTIKEVFTGTYINKKKLERPQVRMSKIISQNKE